MVGPTDMTEINMSIKIALYLSVQQMATEANSLCVVLPPPPSPTQVPEQCLQHQKRVRDGGGGRRCGRGYAMVEGTLSQSGYVTNIVIGRKHPEEQRASPK